MDPEPKPTPEPPVRRSMAFRKRRTSPLPSREESRRQSDVLQSAWRHFGDAESAMAFLNTRLEALDGLPLHLAIESDEGLQRVQSLLERMTLEK